MTYQLTFIRRFWFNKTFKKVKGNLFPSDLPKNLMLIILEDETRIVIDITKFDGYIISKELFYINAKKAKEESNGQADIT